MMIARLERHVRGGPARVVAACTRVAQRLDLRVRLAATVVPAFPERDTVTNENAADRRIWRCIGDRARRELTCPREIRNFRRYGWTSTPFQNATNPSMFFAFSDACG